MKEKEAIDAEQSKAKQIKLRILYGLSWLWKLGGESDHLREITINYSVKNFPVLKTSPY